MGLTPESRTRSAGSNGIALATINARGSSISFDRSTINETFKKPFDVALLAERLKTLIGARKELV